MNKNSQGQSPFADLPAALVDELLGRTESISKDLLRSFNEVRQNREAWRVGLSKAGLLKRESDLDYVPIPTTCGIDGSYAVERLLATDLVAAAAVAVEGLTPPSETRYWPVPRHQITFVTEPHESETGTIARAVMMGMELELGAKAPHGIVFLDGSLTTPIIYFNQALNKIAEAQHLQISARLLERIVDYLAAYQTVLSSHRSDRSWIAAPKYTTRREIGQQLGWPETHDDRGLLSAILLSGEFTEPRPLQSPNQPWHLNLASLPPKLHHEAERLKEAILGLLNQIRVLYYRPHPWLPALRLEMGRSVAQTSARLAAVIHAVKQQCAAAAVMEPYPLYMADRMVKHLSWAIPNFRQVASQRIAEAYDGSIDDIFLGLHGYRTESGR
jgi:hypothetical protein